MKPATAVIASSLAPGGGMARLFKARPGTLAKVEGAIVFKKSKQKPRGEKVPGCNPSINHPEESGTDVIASSVDEAMEIILCLCRCEFVRGRSNGGGASSKYTAVVGLKTDTEQQNLCIRAVPNDISYKSDDSHLVLQRHRQVAERLSHVRVSRS